MIPIDMGLLGNNKLGTFNTASTSPQTSMEMSRFRRWLEPSTGESRAETMIAVYAKTQRIAGELDNPRRLEGRLYTLGVFESTWRIS